ncbi:hypothetical protein FEM03_15325 [Phragmitibacter flavus]|uniref:Alginate lyase domain-containing protein n=1 Tax=Phragmitibacter flavus TaxID=2576071 RepID=A0A5R8KBL9_9BACT|nr:hypothetical protein [Phragmitibacter flavus]TLD69702.1 hypothetical protein FEM03_15325 [Phragmitibacter flavus]
MSAATPLSADDPRAALQAAMLDEDLAAIKAAVGKGRELLGDQAGVPEATDDHRPVPDSARRLTADEARLAAQKSFSKLDQMAFWKIGVDPTRLTSPLRAPASVVACMIAFHRAKLGDDTKALQRATNAADFLIWAQEQAGAGCFPFPAAKNTSQDRAMQVATRFLERAGEAGKLDETVRNGWAYEDHGDGGLQFDNGECGVALLELYEVTQDQRYLDSALKAADWTITRPLCTNWNYNSFSVHLLAKAHQVTKQPKYLEAALKKALLGVIPGQLTDGPQAGRWMDPHNARPAYHYVMMSSLARLASELREDHPDFPVVMKSLRLGLSSRNHEILTLGVMNKDKSAECLTLVKNLFAADESFLVETHTVGALDMVHRLASEEFRRGKFPLGPRGWGELLEKCATVDSLH